MNRNLLLNVYTDIPKIVMGVNESLPWHPCIFVSQQERDDAASFMASLPKGYNVLLEAEAYSANAVLSDEQIALLKKTIEDKKGPCNIILASKRPTKLDYIHSLGSMPIRLMICYYNLCELFIGMNSGVSCITCSWDASDATKRIIFHQAKHNSTFYIARSKEHFVGSFAELLVACSEI